MFGQKILDIPVNEEIKYFMERLPSRLKEFKLNDLRTSNDSLSIRIWDSNYVFTLCCNDSIDSDFKIFAQSDTIVFKKYIFSKNIICEIMDTIKSKNILSLNNDKLRGIDGGFVYFEIATKNTYKVVGYWSPSVLRSNDCKTVSQIMRMIGENIKLRDLEVDFLNSLPPGKYRSWGVSSFSLKIDRFINDSVAKSDFYLIAVEEIKKILNITDKTNHWEYPLIIINKKQSYISELNNYSNSDILKFEVLSKDNLLRSLYGLYSDMGVVIVNTKK